VGNNSSMNFNKRLTRKHTMQPGDEEGVYRYFGGYPPVATIVSAVTKPDSNSRHKIRHQWFIDLSCLYANLFGSCTLLQLAG